MDSDRPHRTATTTTTTSELFICFTSRLSSSSSSMKLSSKSSIHSPGRSRDHPTSLSTSLSRRLRPSGSIKGWQASPMFPTGGTKKRAGGAGFENPEPSSPKVTCIGQVRVKTKKQRKKLQRRHSHGEFSFRRVELKNQSNENQSYQQSICEALRSIGAEFSCLLPCKSSCFSMHEGEGEKGREVEVVVGGGEEEEEVLPVRRHVFDDLEIEDLMPKVKKDCEVVEEEEGRVSICVPPKNALLLMRCRSDPVKMADLTNRFWDPSTVQGDDDDEEEEEEEEAAAATECAKESANVKEFEVIEEGSEKRDSVEVNDEQVNQEVERELKMENLQNEEEELQISDEIVEETEGSHPVIEEEINAVIDSRIEAADADLEVGESEKLDNVVEEKEEEQSRETNSSCSVHSVEEENETEEKEEEKEESTSEKEIHEREGTEFDERESESERSVVLPDCLLLMMCEPKLSMEVSKETWVCSTDFIRCQPEKKKVKQINGGDHEPNKEHLVTTDVSSDSNPPAHHHQPPRSSCSFPAPVPADTSMATVIEQKLVSAVGCEPFVLTRCKSAPMRAAAAASKLGQDTCFWKNRNLEPHRRSSVGVGTAGMGF